MLFTKNRIIFIALILFLLGTMALVITYFLKGTYQDVVVGNQNANSVGTIGGLPGTGTGFNANRQTGGGRGYLPNSNTTGGGDGQDQIGSVANGGRTRASQVTQDSVRSFKQSGQSGLAYYDSNSGALYRLTSSGEKIELTKDRFPVVERVTWDKSGDKAILDFPDGASILLDVTKNERVSLPREGQDFVFQGDSDNLVFNYVSPDPDRNFLVIGSADGSEARAIEPIGDQADRVQTTYSPDGNVVALYRKPAGVGQEEIIFIGQQEENFKSMTVQGTGFKGAWTPDGQRLLYSVSTAENNYNPTLWIVDAKDNAIGLNNTPLGLSTSVDACTLNSDGTRAYCAVQNDLPAGTGLYPELFTPRPADVYEVDLQTGQSHLIATPVDENGRQVPVEQLTLSQDGSELYFVEGRVGKVMKIQLR